MEYKLNKFEEELNYNITKLYKQVDGAKKDYESQLKNFGFNDCITRDIAKIQILESKIEAYENILDNFGMIFERGQENK